MQQTSLKALAEAALARNKAGNSFATLNGESMQFSPSKTGQELRELSTRNGQCLTTIRQACEGVIDPEVFRSQLTPEDLGDIDEVGRVSGEYLRCAALSMANRRPATRESEIANFYRKLFAGQAPIAMVTLDDRRVEEAKRLGLLDTAKDCVILAYRNLIGQALLKIPAEQYDGLAVLHLVANQESEA